MPGRRRGSSAQPDGAGIGAGPPASGPSPTAARPGCLGPWALDRVHNIDCLEGLARLPADCLDVVVTSPPYWGQRGDAGLGLEADPRDYVRNLVAILADAMRCLKPAGTLWLNIGDAYNTPINWRESDHVHSTLGPDRSGLSRANSAYTKNRGRRRPCLKGDVPWLRYGNLLAVPQRVVVAMSDLGFLFRGEVIWEKARPLPEGVCRRPHRKHEGIYIFAKSERHAFTTRPPVGSVWRLSQATASGSTRTGHGSAFPLDLPRRAIEASGMAGPGVVLDPFMGSGTTARAALTLGHSFLGFERDPETCRRANQAIREGARG